MAMWPDWGDSGQGGKKCKVGKPVLSLGLSFLPSPILTPFFRIWVSQGSTPPTGLPQVWKSPPSFLPLDAVYVPYQLIAAIVSVGAHGLGCFSLSGNCVIFLVGWRGAISFWSHRLYICSGSICTIGILRETIQQSINLPYDQLVKFTKITSLPKACFKEYSYSWICFLKHSQWI